MSSQKNVWIALAVVTVIAVGSFIQTISISNKLSEALSKAEFGAVGTRFPNGLAVGTASVTTAGGFFMNSTATTTLSLLSSSTTQGVCIPFNATSTNTLLNLSFGATSTATTVGVEPIIRYGACN